jgi:hypothetical protein
LKPFAVHAIVYKLRNKSRFLRFSIPYLIYDYCYSGSRLRWDGDVTERQGIKGDVTFHDSERDVTRVGTSHDED